MVQIDIPMPKNCKECLFYDGDDWCEVEKLYFKYEGERPKWCPLKENKNDNRTIHNNDCHQFLYRRVNSFYCWTYSNTYSKVEGE